MAKSERYRRFLNVVIAGSILGAVVGVMPSVLERMRGGETPADSSDLLAATPAAGRATTQVTDPDDLARRYQQMDLLRDDLAARQAQIVAQEAALKRDLLGRFWKRQAAVSLATICLSLAVVLAAIWRTMGRRALQGGLPNEEARLRSLQMAVIGGLEEFEANLLQAKLGVSGSPLTDLARAEGRRQATQAAEPVAPVEMPAWGQSSPSSSFFPGDSESAPPAGPLWDAARASLLDDLRQREQEAVARGTDEPSRLTPDEQPTGGSSWARRFLESDDEEPFAHPEGPWTEPADREQPEFASPRVPASQAGPGVREQIEYLASEGCAPSEISRRLGVSREEVGLVLQLRARVAGTHPDPSWAERKAS